MGQVVFFTIHEKGSARVMTTALLSMALSAYDWALPNRVSDGGKTADDTRSLMFLPRL